MSFEWCSPPEPLILGKHEVHVWRASLHLPRSRLESLRQVLSVDESQRAERFYAQQDQDAFVAARGLLRLILSRYLGVEPEDLSFCYGSYGKPALTSEREVQLCFNLSHSHGLALYAVAIGQELGVDLEWRHTDLAYEAIAQRFFSTQESTALLALPAADRCAAFFNCWTCKEAYVKAQGCGIALPLKQFEVSVVPGAAALLSINGDSQAAADWTLQELNPGSDYAAALAIAGRIWQIKCWQWQEALIQR